MANRILMQNKSWTDKSSAYYNSEKIKMHSLIPDGPNIVLDLGCATGKLGRKLRELNKASVLVGAELFKPAADEAAKYYDIVYQGDIEMLNLTYNDYFDVVICGDILEHLRDPWRIVDNIYTWLKNGGILVTSIPNIRYWRILRDVILHGKWEYTDAGILDNTHLRFFTRRSFIKLLRNAKFQVLDQQMVIHGPKQNLFNKISFSLFEEFMGSQFMVLAKKANSDNIITAMHSIL